MTKRWNITFLSFVIISSGINTFFVKANAGLTSGADIYCVMRENGNDHETSWMAAYTNIKLKRSGLFKTSPRQAANTIVENVVSDPIKYKNCISFLRDLYTNKTKPITQDDSESNDPNEEILDYSPSNNEQERYSDEDRYSY
tara:strand:- start:691 stop:1116 length:426 start_codon:yes stop_codon:yes gene_type:complete